MNGEEGAQMIRQCIGLIQPPNSLDWAQLFVEGLICVERFTYVFELCKDDNLVFTLLGTSCVTASYLSFTSYSLLLVLLYHSVVEFGLRLVCLMPRETAKGTKIKFEYKTGVILVYLTIKY